MDVNAGSDNRYSYEFRSWDIYCDGDGSEGCNDDTTVTAEEPEVLVANTTAQDSDCNGLTDGSKCRRNSWW